MIILMGVAGSGKSMQGGMLADKRDYAYLSTGELFRILITGRRRREMIEGNLLSDDEVIAVVDKILDIIDTKEEFILDGFPRTKKQVEWLMEQCEEGRFEAPVVISFEIEEQVIRDRLKKRDRSDDTDEAVTRRYNSYQAVTKPILEQMKQAGVRIIEVNADQTPEAVHEEIVAHLQEGK